MGGSPLKGRREGRGVGDMRRRGDRRGVGEEKGAVYDSATDFGRP